MLLQNLNYILLWYACLFIVGLPFLLFTANFFRNFFDKGYIFSKAIGLGILSYAVYILGLTHLASFSSITIWLTLIVLLLFFNLPFFRVWGKIKLPNIKIIILEEILFLLGILCLSFIRSTSPDIHGLEKFMDYGFINSLLRSDYFPPKDMWFTPFSINYYYFGHLITALLSKMSALPSNITFNLMLATIFAFCFTGSFSIGTNLITALGKEKVLSIKAICGGLLSGILVTFGANLHVVYSLFTNYDTTWPKPFWQEAFSLQTFPNSYWYPNATRFIHNTIHEFPIYSWVVADLHGHVLDIPFVILAIALLLAYFLNTQNKKETVKVSFPFTLLKPQILLGLILSIMYMTNAWDGLIYLLLTVLVLVAVNYNKLGLQNLLRQDKLSTLLYECSLLFGSFIVFVFPFSYYFKPFVSGIGLLSAPEFLVKIGKLGPFIFEANHTQHSPLWQLFVLYGIFLFFILAYIYFFRGANKNSPSDTFIKLLSLISLLLIIIPEFIYVKDIYPDHYRANTMFKLVFQAFIMLSLCSGFIIFKIFNTSFTNSFKKVSKVFFVFITFILLCFSLLYSYFAISSYYGNLEGVKTLDGINYLKLSRPDDYAAIKWIQQNIKGQPVILEAQGDSYTDFGLISSHTGLPTILGWTVHEWLWRGSYEAVKPRIDEVVAIYEAKDENAAVSILKKYQVKYLYLGEQEREKYNINLAFIKKVGKEVYHNQGVVIYKLLW